MQMTVLLFAAFAVASCGDKPAAVGIQTLGVNAKGLLVELPKSLDDLLLPANQAELEKYITDLEAEAPLQNGHSRKIKGENPNQCGVGTSTRITAKAFYTAGLYDYATLKAATHGYAIGEVFNEGRCAPKGMDIPGMTTTVPTKSIWFVVPGSAGRFDSWLVTRTAAGYVKIPSSRQQFMMCPSPNPPHPRRGDHARPRTTAKQCIHPDAASLGVGTLDKSFFYGSGDAKQALLNRAAVTSDDDDDDTDPDLPWTLWFACSQDCCYASGP